MIFPNTTTTMIWPNHLYTCSLAYTYVLFFYNGWIYLIFCSFQEQTLQCAIILVANILRGKLITTVFVELPSPGDPKWLFIWLFMVRLTSTLLDCHYCNPHLNCNRHSRLVHIARNYFCVWGDICRDISDKLSIPPVMSANWMLVRMQLL